MSLKDKELKVLPGNLSATFKGTFWKVYHEDDVREEVRDLREKVKSHKGLMEKCVKQMDRNDLHKSVEIMGFEENIRCQKEFIEIIDGAFGFKEEKK